MSLDVCPAIALLHADPEFFERMSEAERLAAAFDFDLWLRPNQRVPAGDWRSFGMVAGRGFGKTFGIGVEVNRRVREGETRSIALAAPTGDRVQEVQVHTLIETSPPWFKAEAYGETVRWPNGLVADAFSPEKPGRPRSGNYDLCWMTELVDWKASGLLELHHNLATATRQRPAQILWDTTSKGKNALIHFRLGEAERDPAKNIIRRGTTFDNPVLSRDYLSSTCAQYTIGSRRYQEEIEGLVFAESAGSLWQQAWIDAHRVMRRPTDLAVTVVAMDPALSDSPDADESGIILAGASANREDIYILQDLSGRMTPEQWGTIAIDQCLQGASGITIERNHVGDLARTILKVCAERKGLQLVLLGKDRHGNQLPIPPRTPGRVYLVEHTSARGKATRAEPVAALYSRGRVHHVGTLPELELEQTTWEADSTKSPNRLDADVFAVGELAQLSSLAAKKDPASDIEAATKAAMALRLSLAARGGHRL